jgi:carboxypeptidase C (cathepsin A)
MLTARALKLRLGLLSYFLLLVASAPVKTLPGSSDPPTGHHSGYIDVGGLSIFHYYVDHPDPTKPLLVWMNGGPGASSLMGFFTELGPFLLNDRSLPSNNSPETWKLLKNPWSWSNEASLLVWEQPAGVGFSRCPASGCGVWNDTSTAEANMRFLVAFFKEYPKARSRDFYISGESYAGKIPFSAARIAP